MKNVLITGGCGFIGSNFIKHLLEHGSGYYPIILDSLTYAGNKNNLDNFHNDSYVFIKMSEVIFLNHLESQFLKKMAII